MAVETTRPGRDGGGGRGEDDAGEAVTGGALGVSGVEGWGRMWAVW